MYDTDPGLTEDFRQAMRRVASTVNVITICVDGEPMGITATAMSSLAMDPPSLLVCINQAAAMHGSLQDVSHFRPEESSVGKECVSPCRSRCWPFHIKKKTT